MSRLRALLAQTKELLRAKGRKSALERHFLVVDDDSGARQIVCEYLRSFGYKRISEAKNGAEAIELLSGADVDFIISDWEMPEATGIDLLRELKTNPKYRHIPFIMVTSPVSSERSKIENAAGLQVDGYIIKPFRAAVLQEKIQEALATSSIRGRRAALVVDDDSEVRSMIVEFLRGFGYEPVYEAANGDEGYLLVKQHLNEIAFVVSDWEMPKLAGIDLLKRIRTDPSLEKIPFIMVTSQTSIERLKVEQALAADVDHYLLKPFRVADLKAKVEAVIKKAKSLAAIEKELTRGEESLHLYRWEDAIRFFRQAIDLDHKNVRAHVGIGIAHRGLGDEKSVLKAVQYFRKAISINAAGEDAHIELALTFEQARAVDHAIAILRQGAKTCVFSERIRFHLGRLLILRGSVEEGRDELRRALELNPGFEDARVLLEEGEAGEQ